MVLQEGGSVSAHLRVRKQAIADVWEKAVREGLPALENLDRSALVDHLPEFIDGLARWIEGDTVTARVAFDTLAEGHAVQRLGYGIDLETLTREYACLRTALHRELLAVPSTEEVRDRLIRLDQGIDEALTESVRRFMRSRDRVRDRFIGILAHDLRNPLNTIAVAADVIAQARTEVHGAARMIARSAERMGRMIEDVIEFARGHLGASIPIALVPGDMGEICREVVDDLAAGHPERDLQIRCTGDLHGSWDRDRVLQAMSNVVGNALQHGLDPIRVTVDPTADRRAVRTTVKNAGRILSPDELATLFDPFRPERSKRADGLGLGLYIVQQIALAHGARTSVSSTEADGTVFTIVWPRSPSEEDPRT
jgi:signal transduction histidine kinase